MKLWNIFDCSRKLPRLIGSIMAANLEEALRKARFRYGDKPLRCT